MIVSPQLFRKLALQANAMRPEKVSDLFPPPFSSMSFSCGISTPASLAAFITAEIIRVSIFACHAAG